MNKTRKEEKELLLLKAEALRLQLLLDVHQSKQALKPTKYIWQILGWGNGINILRSALTTGKKAPVKTAISVLLASIFLFRKRK